jgi:hypothetical protein
MLEQPSCPALILADDKGDKTEKEQQPQEAGDDGEQGGCDSGTSSNGSFDDDNSDLQDNNRSEDLPPTKKRWPSPSCDPTIRCSRKQRLQIADGGVSTMQATQQQFQEIGEEKEQEGHDSDSIGGSQSGSDHDHRDDQDSDDSEGPRPAKQHWPSRSSNDPTSKRSQKQRLQRTHDSCLTSLSKPARADLAIRKELRRPSPLLSDDSDDSEAP